MRRNDQQDRIREGRAHTDYNQIDNETLHLAVSMETFKKNESRRDEVGGERTNQQ